MDRNHDGHVTLRSASGFKATLDWLPQILKAEGVTIFAQIDRAATAERQLSKRIIVSTYH